MIILSQCLFHYWLFVISYTFFHLYLNHCLSSAKVIDTWQLLRRFLARKFPSVDHPMSCTSYLTTCDNERFFLQYLVIQPLVSRKIGLRSPIGSLRLVYIQPINSFDTNASHRWLWWERNYLQVLSWYWTLVILISRKPSPFHIRFFDRSINTQQTNFSSLYHFSHIESLIH